MTRPRGEKFQTLIGTVKTDCLYDADSAALFAFQTLIGTVKTWPLGLGMGANQWTFQTLIGTVKTSRAHAVFGEREVVSNPHRYGQNLRGHRVPQADEPRFQTLIGTVKTGEGGLGADAVAAAFQTLIGTVKTFGSELRRLP